MKIIDNGFVELVILLVLRLLFTLFFQTRFLTNVQAPSTFRPQSACSETFPCLDQPELAPVVLLRARVSPSRRLKLGLAGTRGGV